MKCSYVVCSILYVLLEMRILKNVLNKDEFFGRRRKRENKSEGRKRLSGRPESDLGNVTNIFGG